MSGHKFLAALGDPVNPVNPAEALALGLAAHVQRWSTSRGASPAAAWAAACAAQALSLAGGHGHVCLWLRDLGQASATLPAPPGAPGLVTGTATATATATAIGSSIGTDAWRALLLASAVVGTAAQPDNQPLVLDSEGRLYLHRQFDLEQRLARRLQRSAGALPRDVAADQASAALLAALFGPVDASHADWQRLATAMALRSRLTVISGGPGTGKTSTVVLLLACLLARDPDARVVLAAPTGKAAARLAEAVQQRAAQLGPAHRALLQGLPTGATTVHRLLGVRPGRSGLAGAGEQAFEHHASTPLALDVLVLDEASMLDLALATRLLEAVPDAARIILLGDKDQLAAVEAGAVFAELGADPRLSAGAKDHLAQLSGMPASLIQTATLCGPAAPPAVLQDSVVWFQRNFRFAAESGIGRLAADALSGKPAALLATLRTAAAPASTANDLAWLDDSGHQSGAATLEAIADGYAAYVQACGHACPDVAAGGPQAARAITTLSLAFGSFRLLCALRTGPRGVLAMNAQIARLLRPALAAAMADALVGSRNDSLNDDRNDHRNPWHAGRPVMVLRNHPALKLFNGDIGLTLPAPGGGLQVWFPSAGGPWRAVAPARLPAHETAWAMTVHKAQGSEFNTVLLLLPAQRSRVLCRELLYTGITRARARLLLAAGADVLAQAVQTSSQRNTGLQARLRESLSAAAEHTPPTGTQASDNT